jgi:hypothetical protein
MKSSFKALLVVLCCIVGVLWSLDLSAQDLKVFRPIRAMDRAMEAVGQLIGTLDPCYSEASRCIATVLKDEFNANRDPYKLPASSVDGCIRGECANPNFSFCQTGSESATVLIPYMNGQDIPSTYQCNTANTLIENKGCVPMQVPLTLNDIQLRDDETEISSLPGIKIMQELNVEYCPAGKNSDVITPILYSSEDVKAVRNGDAHECQYLDSAGRQQRVAYPHGSVSVNRKVTLHSWRAVGLPAMNINDTLKATIVNVQPKQIIFSNGAVKYGCAVTVKDIQPGSPFQLQPGD